MKQKALSIVPYCAIMHVILIVDFFILIPIYLIVLNLAEFLLHWSIKYTIMYSLLLANQVRISLLHVTNGNCSRLYFTVKLDKSITCVIHFPVLCDVDFHAVLTIFYTCVWHCLIQHPVYSDTKLLSTGMSDKTARFHCISIIVFSIPCRHLEHHRVFQRERTKHVRARLRA